LTLGGSEGLDATVTTPATIDAAAAAFAAQALVPPTTTTASITRHGDADVDIDDNDDEWVLVVRKNRKQQQRKQDKVRANQEKSFKQTGDSYHYRTYKDAVLFEYDDTPAVDLQQPQQQPAPIHLFHQAWVQAQAQVQAQPDLPQGVPADAQVPPPDQDQDQPQDQGQAEAQGQDPGPHPGHQQHQDLPSGPQASSSSSDSGRPSTDPDDRPIRPAAQGSFNPDDRPIRPAGGAATRRSDTDNTSGRPPTGTRPKPTFAKPAGSSGQGRNSGGHRQVHSRDRPAPQPPSQPQPRPRQSDQPHGEDSGDQRDPAKSQDEVRWAQVQKQFDTILEEEEEEDDILATVPPEFADSPHTPRSNPRYHLRPSPSPRSPAVDDLADLSKSLGDTFQKAAEALFGKRQTRQQRKEPLPDDILHQFPKDRRSKKK